MSDTTDARFQRAATLSVVALFVLTGALVAVLMAVGAQRTEPVASPPAPNEGKNR